MVPFVTVALDATVVEVVIEEEADWEADRETDWEADKLDTPVVTTVV